MADSVHDALPFYQDRQDSACMLTILNARLPWCESVELLSRAQENDWPVLFLTAEAANVAHLQSLFDLPCDALVHPFSPKQLMNAVENLLLLSQSLLRAGPLRLDTLHHRVTMAGEHLTLTAQEFALLEVLVKTPGGSRLPRNAPADGVGLSGFRRNPHSGRAHPAFAAETGQIVHRNGV